MRQFSALDYFYLLKELQVLVGGRIDQIYHPSKKELIVQFYIPTKGKKILRIMPGKILYLTESKQEHGQPSSFCLFLRKYLGNSRVGGIKQLGFERIISFFLETKQAKYQLIIELFDKGNIILLDKENKIINCLEQQKWKDREIKKGLLYKYPKKEYNFLELKIKDLKELLKKSNLNLVKTLATQLGLGGLYSEEVCLASGINKKSVSNQLAEKDIKKIFEVLSELKEKEIGAKIIFKNKKILDITPFSLGQHKKEECKKTETFNESLDSYFTKEIISPAELTKQKAIEKQQKVIEKQKQHIKKLEKEIKENQKKAELIYEKYSLVKEILDQINKAKEKYSWKEIKEKLGGHKIVKEVDAKEKKVVLEI